MVKNLSNSTEHFLKRRSKIFLEHAYIDFNNGNYDLALFHAEQALQLYVKYLLYKKLGEFPKTCSLTRLVKELVKVYGSLELHQLYNEYVEVFHVLEDSYIASRYLPREYDKVIAEKVFKFVEKVLEVLKCLEEKN